MVIPAPSNSEKKPHMNGHASPSHLAANVSNNHGVLEGYMKTDDRMRLAKERREERERSLAAREQLIREKERRARLQYERTVEERWRRLEEQRQKEEQRRAAVEEKRRQQLEEERERLEALMKRSLERSLQLEQRTKRWSRGCPTGAAPCSPHRSPFCSSLNPADHSRAGLHGGSQSTPNTPKKERLRRERRTASPGCGSPVRRSESPASVNKHLASPTTSKLVSRMRAQSPSSAHQYHYSPTRQRPNLTSDDRKSEEKKPEKNSELSKTETAVKKNPDVSSTNSSSQADKNVVNIDITKSQPSKGEHIDKHLKVEGTERNQSPDRKNQMSPKVDSSEKKVQNNVQDGDKKKESAACTLAGKAAAGTTNAEEATRLLAERRRQARAQKEIEEKKREQEEEERLRDEQLKKQLVQEQRQQEAKAQQVKEREKNEEDNNRLKEEEEDKQKKEQQEKELQTQMDREKEKAKVQAQEDAERQRQDRELQAQQEEEERQLRKKRIEEIMKRTRKGEADLKKEEQAEAKSAGDVKTVQTTAQVSEQAVKKVEFQVKQQVQVKTKEAVKKEAASPMDNQKSAQVKNNTHLAAPTHNVPDKRPDAKQSSEEQSSHLNKDAKACVLKQQGKETEVNVNKQHTNVKVTDQTNKGPTKPAADAKVNQREGSMMNGAVKGEGSALVSSHRTAEVSKQKSLDVTSAEGKAQGGSRVEVVRPPVTPLPVGSLPIIKLEPLDVKRTGSGDEVQSMEVSPASREELISIPEFSPINEMQHSGMSNTRALEDLIDLTGSATYPKLSSDSNIGDCNKNLIEGVVSPMSDSKLIGVSPPSSNKLSVQ
ncbi:MAP7 domain-containing protein 2a [Stegastes partitus]|uniref:MAP7 domain-containing protein 2a n=1 Tax=Stegastes partitus TaxID=144197 RepID=A0A9Y4JFQ3_9TELE|nr:PREDICTED: MAP7 domain-containing protein 2-like [Stegastes partitus]